MSLKSTPSHAHIHSSSLKPKASTGFFHTHVTGESEFIDDRPLQKGELFIEVIYSPIAHGKISELPSKEELKKLPGVFDAFNGHDFYHNVWGTIYQDQPLLATDIVQFAGEPILLLVGEDPITLRKSAKSVKIKITPLPALLSIDAARNANSFIADEKELKRGECDHHLKSAPFQKSGTVILAGADHFYLESQASVAYPGENDEIEIHSSSQHPTEVQHVISHALGLPSHTVTSIVKRMGGGFGGKESQSSHFAAFSALVAHQTKRPARLILTKDDDMIMTGKRNPFQIDFKVGFNREGKILALKANLFSDGGAYADLSTSILERALLHCDNAYYIPHIHVKGRVCKTHTHPHTAFRGFGGPKGVAMIESIIEEIAHTLKKDALEIRKINLYNKNKIEENTTHYGQIFENNILAELIDTLESSSDYQIRRAEILKSNLKNIKEFQKTKSPHLTLRGLSLTPVKFGISFTTRFLNQASALLLIHRDGSLQVTTGATEMGQGVHARIQKLLSDDLGIDISDIRISSTRTDKNPNTSPTAASSGTDLNGAAALNASKKIKQRLTQMALFLFSKSKEQYPSKTAPLNTQNEIQIHPYVEITKEHPDYHHYQDIHFENGFVFSKSNPLHKIAFKDLINETYLSRVSLIETGFYKIPNLDFNKVTGKGNAFLYFTEGAAVTETSIQLLTGEAKVCRTDILMDVGKPVLEELDIGQITGAYVQGMGWMTTENLFYKNGFLQSHSPSTYKIPSIQDTPRIFNVACFKNEENHANIVKTKAVGEPPLLLALSVWTSLSNALCSLTEYENQYPRLPVPATQEVLLKSMLLQGNLNDFRANHD